MLKKALTYAALTGAATAAAVGTTAAPAAASDSVGGDYSQNVNLVPHPCVDLDRVTVGLIAAVPVDLLNDNDAIQCDEISTGGVKHHQDKAPLSDLLDSGANNS